MIDEIKCELQSPDENASAAVSHMLKQHIISTRASNISDQELKTYFNSADGSKYIASMSLNNSTESIFDIVMDFRWYASQGDSTQGTHTNTMNGWSEISVGDNNSDGNMDTAVRHTEHMPAALADLSIWEQSAVTYGPDNKVTKFVTSLNDQDLGFPIVYQGVTDETKYRRRTLQASNNAVLDTSCFDRSKQWANTYDYNLYDNVTGAEVTISVLLVLLTQMELSEVTWDIGVFI